MPDGRLRLFYPSNGLGSAISSDGFNFTIEPGSRLGVTGDIDLQSGGYRILFPSGQLGSQTLGSAVSTDGFTFTLEPGARYTPVAQDAGIVQVPHVVKLPDGRWRLYFVADFQGGSPNKNSTRTAISSDEGLTFTAESGGGAFSADWVDPNVLYLSNGGFRLYFKMGGPAVSSIFAHTDSVDGLSFASTFTTDLEASSRLDPFVVKLPDGTVRMFFGTPQGILSATAQP